MSGVLNEVLEALDFIDRYNPQGSMTGDAAREAHADLKAYIDEANEIIDYRTYAERVTNSAEHLRDGVKPMLTITEDDFDTSTTMTLLGKVDDLSGLTSCEIKSQGFTDISISVMDFEMSKGAALEAFEHDGILRKQKLDIGITGHHIKIGCARLSIKGVNDGLLIQPNFGVFKSGKIMIYGVRHDR